LKAAPIPAIHLNSFPTQPHIILKAMPKTLAAFKDGYPEITMISPLKLSYLFTALIAILDAPNGLDKSKGLAVR